MHDGQSQEDISRLVERAKQGNREAFGEIYRLYRQTILKYASFRLDKMAAEDAVLETFSRAWKGLPTYKPTGAPFVAWLYGIAHDVVVDQGRR